MSRFVLAIDNGTTSTRAIIFDENAQGIAQAQLPTAQVFPAPGWVEQSAAEVWDNTFKVIGQALTQAGISADELSGLGITTQRETTICWNKTTGEVLHNAIVWQDTRTQDWLDAAFSESQRERITELTGLPVTAYFSASKMRWLIDNVPAVQQLAHDANGSLAFGTPDAWIAWNLTGGINGGRHVTDVTNASRTSLMDMSTLRWSEELCELFGLSPSWLPEIVPSIGVIAPCVAPAPGAQLACILGDQQAASFGQCAVKPGQAKNTYGTGNFLMVNTGTQRVISHNGLIATIAYQISGEQPHYALEGSVAVSGSLIQWLRDNLELISDANEAESLARSVEDNGDVYVVPAFSGLFAPYWRPDARGVIVGLTRYVTKAHIVRASLESTAFQSWDVIDAAQKDAHLDLNELRVDGGMVGNDLLMQFQADLLGIPVVRPAIAETTALGAAFGAGLATGVWSSQEQLEQLWHEDKRWLPTIDESKREQLITRWHKAVTKSLDWED